MATDSARRVAIVATGGTIASVVRGNGAVATLDSSEVLRQAGVADADVGPVIEVARVNSSDMTPDLMVRVAAECGRLLPDPDVAGVVVLHGTDTLEETAFVCDLIVPSSKPVVFTGAMRPADSADADGPGNVRRAIALARHDVAGQLGAVVCMGGDVLAARWARKADSVNVRPFAAPQFGVLGTFEEIVRRPLSPPPAWSRQVLPIPHEPLPAVPLVSVYTGMPQDLLLAMVEDQDARGLVLEGFGAGNLPGNLAAPIGKLMSGGVVVAVATRVEAGGAHSAYGGPGGHAGLIENGAVSSPWLTAAKTRLLLQLCLASGVADPVALFTGALQSPARETEDPS